jgi:hypothetical protein
MRKKKLKREDYDAYAQDLALRKQLIERAKSDPILFKSMAAVLPQRGRLKQGKNYFNAAQKKRNTEKKKQNAVLAKQLLLAELAPELQKYVKARGHAAYTDPAKLQKIKNLALLRHKRSTEKKEKVGVATRMKARLMESLNRLFTGKVSNKNIILRGLKTSANYGKFRNAAVKRITKRIGVTTKEQKMDHIAQLIGMPKKCIKITKACLDQYEPDYKV